MTGGEMEMEGQLGLVPQRQAALGPCQGAETVQGGLGQGCP